jgi:hypothetical protein
VPSFDKYSSNPGDTETAFLREVLGPATPRTTSLRVAASGYRRRQRRSVVRRAVIVLALAAGFCGSALMFGDKGDSGTPSTRRVSTDGPATTGSTALKARAYRVRSSESVPDGEPNLVTEPSEPTP